MTVETLEFLIEELRIQAITQSVDSGLTADQMLEWDVADTLSEVRSMLEAAIAEGGPAGVLAEAIRERLLRVSLEGYGA